MFSAPCMKWQRSIITFGLLTLFILITQTPWFRSANFHFGFLSILHLRMSNLFPFFFLFENLLLSLRWNINLWSLFNILFILSVILTFLNLWIFHIALLIVFVVWGIVTFLYCRCLSTYQIILNLLSLIKYVLKIYPALIILNKWQVLNKLVCYFTYSFFPDFPLFDIF